MSERRAYNSPLRAAQTEDTRERILQAAHAVLGRSQDGDVTIDQIAAEAAIQKRTIFRHFDTREALFDALWVWLNRRLALNTLPTSAAEIVEGPRRAFAKFDTAEGAIRASLHSPSGRAMRARTTAARRAAFSAALAPRLANLDADTRRKVEALAHLLYSAPAWEVLKDFGGLTGAQAGETASWAFELILSAVGPGETQTADVSS